MAIIRDVIPSGIESVYAERPFDKAKVELEEAGYQIISLKQFADLRIAQGKESHVANYGAYVKEGFLYVPQKGVFLVRNSPIMANAKEATECHRQNKDFYLTQEQVDEALKDSVQFKNSNSIPTKRFGEDEKTVFAFGDSAKAYGEFLKDARISEMPVYLANVEKKPFARQAWLRGLDDGDGSGLVGGGYLDCNDAVRGARNIDLTRKIV